MDWYIYYRGSRECMDNDELKAAKNNFICVPNRTSLPDHIGECDGMKFGVIPRYSLLPFAKELEEDVTRMGGRLINDYHQFSYIADLKNWVYDLGSMTFETWDRLEDLPDNCSFVLKGATNSRKFDWSTMMFAKDKKTACEVYSLLCRDGLIGYQDIYIRKYEPLLTYFTGLQGLPITKEFRFFVAFGKVISSGFYWASHTDQITPLPDPKEVPEEFLERAINILRDKANFFTIDIAQKENGDWVIVEINSGEMSGLSCNNPEILYSNLRQVLEEQYGMQESY